MENAKVKLGDTEATRIGLGTNRLTNTREHIAFLKEAVADGVNHIDTAYSYTGGESEETIGAALSPFTDGYVVATKGGYRAGEGSPDVLRAQIEESLRRSPGMLPIPGTLSLEHLKQNLGALEIELSDDEFEALS